MDLLTWLGIIVAVWLAGRIGWSMHEAYFFYILHRHPERLQEALRVIELMKTDEDGALDLAKRLNDENSVEVTLEKQGAHLYAYAKVTGEFLAQGTTWEEVQEQAKKRWPEIKLFGETSQTNSAKQLVNN
jgi:hypothetical protein